MEAITRDYPAGVGIDSCDDQKLVRPQRTKKIQDECLFLRLFDLAFAGLGPVTFFTPGEDGAMMITAPE